MSAEQKLTRREWDVLRKAAGFPEYWWSPATCAKLTDKGLMKRNPVLPCYYVTDAGRQLIAEADALQRRILESE